MEQERTPENGPAEEQAFDELDHLFDDERDGARARVRPVPTQPEAPRPGSSTQAVTDAIFAESAALAMNEIAERLDGIERAVASRLAAVDRRVDERLARVGDVAARLEAAEAEIRRNAERTIESLRALASRVDGRIESLDQRLDGVIEAVDQLRRAMQALGEYVRRMAPGPPANPQGPPGGPSREQLERIWREPT